jgi:hypothetical protein
VSIRQKRIEGSNPSRSAISPFIDVHRRSPKAPNFNGKTSRIGTLLFVAILLQSR